MAIKKNAGLRFFHVALRDFFSHLEAIPHFTRRWSIPIFSKGFTFLKLHSIFVFLFCDNYTGNLFPIRSIKVEKLKPTPAVIGQEAEPSLGSLHSITGVRETTNHSSGFYSPADVARSLSTSWGWPVCLQIALLPETLYSVWYNRPVDHGCLCCCSSVSQR